MTKAPNILLAGGGSLGCIYPGLSIARELRGRMPDARITIAGDGRAIERHTVRAAGLRYGTIPRCDAPSGPLTAVDYVARNVAGWCVAHWLLREQEIDLVISLGGHASGPVVRAAAASRIPFTLVEQNCLPQPATRCFGPSAAAVCLAFEETAARLPIGSPTRWTGGVARPGFEDAFGDRVGSRPVSASDDGRPRLLVLGGAAGATTLNESMPAALARLGNRLSGWQVVHQTGEGWLGATESRYRSVGIDAVVVSYVDELAHLARSSDLIVCRPGGSTLAELALSGLPAVLVPDSRRHRQSQAENAATASLRYGCPVVAEGEGLEVRLAEALRGLTVSPAARDRISARIAQDASPQASRVIAEAACEAVGYLPVARRQLAA